MAEKEMTVDEALEEFKADKEVKTLLLGSLIEVAIQLMQGGRKRQLKGEPK